ncbi:hypothetical protein Acor_54330 [Acrocarpospora corrugata]|uniref:Uncharacterized protein n=1 Tax=Acrocarpospora corrugata TaxID=35763 RepID=A0A5M3W2R6_9ACTN|nr:MFS transporter [Acrocarpospora corrugata]GES03367.1 hypothetical protein Acor_54330 [Acrocarpospora corrugata]
MSPREPSLRLTRAAVFATVCVIASAAGHAFAGGGSVPVTVMALGAFGVLGMAYALNGRERGAEVVPAVTITAQVILHQLFAWAAPGMLPHTEHEHPFGMLLVHLALAVLTGWWLQRGERAVWLMLRLWATGTLFALSWLFGMFRQQFPPVRQAAPADEPEPHLGWEIATAVWRHGPPLTVRAG